MHVQAVRLREIFFQEAQIQLSSKACWKHVRADKHVADYSSLDIHRKFMLEVGFTDNTRIFSSPHVSVLWIKKHRPS